MMCRRFIVCALSCLAVVSMFGQSTALSDKINALIETLPKGSEVGISAYDLTTGSELYSYRGDKLSRPASTMKLLTAVTALDCQLPDSSFCTAIYHDGTLANDTLHGNLYVVGGFDPEFDDDDMDSLVAKVASLPFSVVSGNIYGDVSMKDSLYWGRGWAWDDTPDYYQPYLSPLMLSKGTIKVTASPGAHRGDKANVVCKPYSSYYNVINNTRTCTPSAGAFGVTRDWLVNGNNVVVSGDVSNNVSAEINIYSSQDLFMHVFMERLAKCGVSLPDSYSFAELPSDTTVVNIATNVTPLQNVIVRMMKKSDNLNAEALLHRVGAYTSGKRYVSASDGLRETCEMLRRAGCNPSDYKFVDGSGLSNYDYLSPSLLVSVLRYAYSKTDVFRRLYKALPVAGVDGTLRNRMKGGKAYKNVHAKTGSYTAINALTGYLRRSDGHYVAFAIMNQNILSAAAARQFQDKVCHLLCE